MNDPRQIQVATPEGTYPVFVGAGLLRLGSASPQPLPPTVISHLEPTTLGTLDESRACVITSRSVGELYASALVATLRSSGFDPFVYAVPDGEASKTLDAVRSVYDALVEHGSDRRSIIFALGGGVVGDLAGFVAATYMRGVPLVQLPTTLLAMVDSSIGGKVAVDHPRGKNLIGAFKQPRAVIADLDVLATLPDLEWRAGMAEVVKHAILGDAALFEILRGDRRGQVHEWLERAIRVKVDHVIRDPFEQGERAKLNLGHTFGHALELGSDYSLRHGEAVSIGLVCAARLSALLDLCDESLTAQVSELLDTLRLPTRVPRELTTDSILDVMQTDKKRVGARLRFVLPRALGVVELVDNVSREQIAAAIDATRE